MKSITFQEMTALQGGSWWSDALDFGAGACAGLGAVRVVASIAAMTVPGGAAVWAGITLGCVAIGAGAYYT